MLDSIGINVEQYIDWGLVLDHLTYDYNCLGIDFAGRI